MLAAVQRAGYGGAGLIGVGAFAHVYAARREACGTRVAIKHAIGGRDESDRRRLVREIKILQILRGCDNVCRLLHVFLGDEAGDGPHMRGVFVVTELAQTDLHAALFAATGGPSWLSIQHCQLFVYQLLCALKFMHSAGIVHRDINLRNLLVNANGDLRLCDFGLATHDFDALRWRLAKSESDALLPTASMAPEVLLHWKRCGKPADVYAAGAVLATLLNVVAATATSGAAAITAENSSPFRTADPLTDTGQLVEVFRVLGLPESPVLKNIRMVASSRTTLDAAVKEYNAGLAEPNDTRFGSIGGGAGGGGGGVGHSGRGGNGWCSDNNGLAAHLLRFDPKQRPTAACALEDEWFRELRNDVDEPAFDGNARDVEAIFHGEGANAAARGGNWFAKELEKIAAASLHMS